MGATIIKGKSKPAQPLLEQGGWYWITGASGVPALCVCVRTGPSEIALIDIDGGGNRWIEPTSPDDLQVRVRKWSIAEAKVTINAE